MENTKSSSENQLDALPGHYPFVKWQWKYIRAFSSLATLLVILGCFGSSFTLIAHLPQRCDPSTDWWQGKVFYTLNPASFHDSDGDGVGDIRGLTLKLDYLQMILHVQAIRLNSIFQENSGPPPDFTNALNYSMIDPRIGDSGQFADLIRNMEGRNMSLVIDLPIGRLAGAGMPSSSHFGRHQHILVDNTLRFWLQQGVHGFYLTVLMVYDVLS